MLYFAKKLIYNQTMKQQYLKLENLSDEHFQIKNYYKKTMNPDFSMDFHMHPQLEIMYCARGAFVFYYKEKEFDEYKQVTISENCFIIVNTGYFHKISITSAETKMINIELMPVDKNELTNSTLSVKIKYLFSINETLAKMKDSKLFFHILSDTRNIKETLLNIIENAHTTERPQDSDILINLMITKLIIDISHCNNVEEEKTTGISYVKAAMAYINKNYMSKIHAEDIAASAGISVQYLQKLFRQELQRSVHDALTKVRLEHAKYLIINSRLSTSEIATVCGFNKREHLIYNFKKFEGCTPTEYKLQKNNAYIGKFQSTGMIELIDDE